MRTLNLSVIAALVACRPAAPPASAPSEVMQEKPRRSCALSVPRTTAFFDEVRRLQLTRPDPEHASAVRALRALADVLRGLSYPNLEDGWKAGDIQFEAYVIESSTSQANTHARSTRSALSSGLDAIEALTRQCGMDAPMRRAVARARAAVGRIDVWRPYIAQRGTIGEAFSAVADSVAVFGKASTDAFSIAATDPSGPARR